MKDQWFFWLWFSLFNSVAHEHHRDFWDVFLGDPRSPDAETRGKSRMPSTFPPYGYGSIPIDTIFSGMNIHLPAILMFTRGTRFWHTTISFPRQISWLRLPPSKFHVTLIDLAIDFNQPRIPPLIPKSGIHLLPFDANLIGRCFRNIWFLWGFLMFSLFYSQSSHSNGIIKANHQWGFT